MTIENIENNYKNINWYGEQMNLIATTYRAHAGKETFIDKMIVKGSAKDLRRLAKHLTELARTIENENN